MLRRLDRTEEMEEIAMIKRITGFSFVILMAFLLTVLGSGPQLYAQSTSDSDPILKLYVDPATHIVYTVPGRGRRLLTEIPASALSARDDENRREKTERILDRNQARLAE